MPYHTLVPWLRFLAFAGLFVSLVYFILYTQRRYALWVAALFVVGVLIPNNQQRIVAAVPAGIAWLTAWLVPNNPRGFLVLGALVLAPWAYLIWRWRREPGSQPGQRPARRQK